VLADIEASSGAEDSEQEARESEMAETKTALILINIFFMARS
jgi:hypothetical protein